MKVLSASVTNISQVISVNLLQSHNQATTYASVECISPSVSLGDQVTVTLGYVGDTALMLTGYVKQKYQVAPPDVYTIVIHDTLIRAVDYYIAVNPATPITKSYILAEDLVEDLLQLAGISSYSLDSPSYTYAVNGQLEINLTNVYDFIASNITKVLAWHIYAQPDGTIRFLDRKPYVMGGDSSIATITSADVITSEYRTSTDELRNRVAVYGASDIVSISEAYNANLGYDDYGNPIYKTVVISTRVIDTQANADTTASVNLTKWNRVTEVYTATIEGNPNIQARTVITVNDTKLGVTGDDWYVYSANHAWSESGYTTQIECRK